MTRKTDRNHDSLHFQVGRFALQNGEWFYSTRERVERGPFTNKSDAQNDLATYISNRPGIGETMWQSEMSRKTDTDNTSVFFQMNRFAIQNGEWFYATREDVERGPFGDKGDAESDLSSYIYHCHNVEKYSH